MSTSLLRRRVLLLDIMSTHDGKKNLVQRGLTDRVELDAELGFVLLQTGEQLPDTVF